MLRVIYVSVSFKHYLMTIYKCVEKADYYIYQMNETYVKVVNHFLIFISYQLTFRLNDLPQSNPCPSPRKKFWFNNVPGLPGGENVWN